MTSYDERRLRWDERHAAGDFEGHGPNPTLMAAAASLRPGHALELAAGSGTNAIWLATRGWQVTGVDWSSVALANGRMAAAAAGVEIDWLERDLFAWSPPELAFDLVAAIYLHLPPDERRQVYSAAAAAVRPGGRLVVIGHDRLNHSQGEGGPPDPDRLFTAAELGTELAQADRGLVIERADVIRRVPPPGRGPIDALLVIRREPNQELQT